MIGGANSLLLCPILLALTQNKVSEWVFLEGQVASAQTFFLQINV